jgi:hypothetical protein
METIALLNCFFNLNTKNMKNLYGVILFVASFVACKKEDIVPALPPVTEVSYSSVDSIKVDSIYLRQGYIDQAVFDQVNNKQYIVKNSNARINYQIVNGNFIIVLIDTSANKLNNQLKFIFANKGFDNIAGTYSFTSNGVELFWVQEMLNTSSSYISVSSGTTTQDIIAGTITIQTDVENRMITGKIEKLRYRFSDYIPIYQNLTMPSNSLQSAIRASGSTRNQEIIFKNVKKG